MKQNGFSIIELMIVMLIIGILAAIAIPHFQAYRATHQATSAPAKPGGGGKAL